MYSKTVYSEAGFALGDEVRTELIRREISLLQDDPGAIEQDQTAEIVADPTVEPGGCIVDVDACSIDAQIGSAIERMRAALG